MYLQTSTISVLGDFFKVVFLDYKSPTSNNLGITCNVFMLFDGITNCSGFSNISDDSLNNDVIVCLLLSVGHWEYSDILPVCKKLSLVPE